MKYLKLLLILGLLSISTFAADIKNGEDLISAMHKKYDGKWYRTLTFEQKTIHHQPDGTTTSETWFEALNCPGKLRIDFDPVDNGNGILFADGTIFSFKDGKTGGGRPFVHPLLVLGFDVYCQSAQTTIAQVKGLGIDLSVLHIEKLQGKDAYVVGAAAGDLKAPQFWIDKKSLLFVRLIQPAGRDKKSLAETQFNKYIKAGKGWVAAEVLFFIDGKATTSEEYSNIRSGMVLSNDLWESGKWMSADRSYAKQK